MFIITIFFLFRESKVGSNLIVLTYLWSGDLTSLITGNFLIQIGKFDSFLKMNNRPKKLLNIPQTIEF